MKAFVGRGALAGLISGVFGAMFLWLVTEKQIRAALVIEAAGSAAGGHDEMFSRNTQVLGGMAATVPYGLFIGVVFGVICAILWARLPLLSTFARSMRLAALGFVGWVLVPALKYPANPPSVGDPATVGERTSQFLALLAASVFLLCAAWSTWRRLTERGMDGARRFSLVVGGYAFVIGLLYALLPGSGDDSSAIPADLLWRFRLDSIGGQLLVWITMGTAFGWMAHRAETTDQPVGFATTVPSQVH
jgi:hypothetical protein